MLFNIVLCLSLLAPVVALPALLLMVRVEQWAARSPAAPDSTQRTRSSGRRTADGSGSTRHHSDRQRTITAVALGPHR